MNSMPNSLDDEINSSEGEANNLIEIYVKDTGIGMSEKELSILKKKVLFLYISSYIYLMKMKKYLKNQLV